MQTWVRAELASADLGDVRREKRLQILVDQLSQNPEGSLNQVCPRSADKKAAYRFFANEHVNPESIREAHQESTWRRTRSYERILVVQDTSSLSYTGHRKVAGVGPLDNAEGRGFLVHSGLAVTEQGEPLGLAHQQIWVRSEEDLGQSEQRRERKWQEKESYKWQATVETVCRRRKKKGQEIIVIGDRESDVYGLLASPRPEGVELLVRSAQNRRVEAEAQYLYTALRQAPVAGKVVVAVSRTGNREPRKATCAVRYQEATLRPPRHGDKGVPKVGVTVWAISVEELHPPQGEGGIRWVLLTTWPVRDFGAAVEAARFYGLRWLVERYHFVLKSGCHVEQAELREQIRLERLQAVYTIIAWRLLAMTYQARLDPKSACEPTFTPLEWQLMYAFQHHKPYPEAQPPPTIQEAVQWVGKLGGFWGRKGDGPPGVKVIWRGLIRLYGLVDGYRLASLLSPEVKCG